MVENRVEYQGANRVCMSLRMFGRSQPFKYLISLLPSLKANDCTILQGWCQIVMIQKSFGIVCKDMQNGYKIMRFL